jgi:two-component system sensor histidine kinase ChvG
MSGIDGRPWLRLVHSFTLKLVLLALILLSVPLILYWQFARAEEAQLALVRNAVTQTNHVLAGMLQTHFENFASEPAGEMQRALVRAAGRHARVKILVRLRDSENFLYVAAVPSVSRAYLDAERAELMRSGILGRLGPSCDSASNLAARFVNPAGAEEVLAAMTPVHVAGNCWIVITTENAANLMGTAAGRPFWREPTVLIAAIIYFTATALVLLLFIHLSRNVRRFREAARHLRLHDRKTASFRATNTIPELNGVAEDFDALVNALTVSQARIKETAEENSHALKTPLAVIAQSVEPVKRAIPPEQAAARRSIALIEQAVLKLDAMVSAQRDLEQAGADMIYPVRQPLDLSRFLGGILPAFEASLAVQGKRLVAAVDAGVMACANEDALEPVIENILENAASFTPAGKPVEVGLQVEGRMACLRVRDHGPGVMPAFLPHIFERGASFRDPQENSELGLKTGHQGLGLWIVRRNIEALGGSVEARNRAQGGFEIVVRLPVDA